MNLQVLIMAVVSKTDISRKIPKYFKFLRKCILRVRRSQKLLLVQKFTCTNKNGNFVKENDTSGYIVV